MGGTTRGIMLVIVALLWTGGARTAELPAWLKLNPSGDFTIVQPGNKTVQGAVCHYDKDWKSVVQNKQSMSDIVGEGASLRGKLTTVAGGVFELSQSLNVLADGAVDYSLRLESAQEIPTNQLCLSLRLPVEEFAGKSVLLGERAVELPQNMPEDNVVLATVKAGRIVLPMLDGKLVISSESELSCLLQDNRKFNNQSYSLRINVTRDPQAASGGTLKLRLSREQYDAAALDIRGAVNMGFRDEIADDGKGGWTDQGPNNDLRMIPTGLKRFGGIPFDIIDPAQNDGRSCLVLAGPAGGSFPESAQIALSGQEFRYLYLLHAAAWAKGDDAYGVVRVVYRDGSETAFEIKGRRDVADWWAAHPVENGAVVWTGENRSTYVGLFMSRFAIERKPIERIELRSTRRAMWMIAAISGSNDDVPLPSGISETYIVAGKEWAPYTHSLDVEPGSALDLTFMTDTPAGKYGRVIVEKGKFAFADRPQQPVRFYGTNLCFSANYLEKEESEALARRLASYGYNSLRIHHHDQNLIDKNAADSLTIDSQQMDKLDYLLFCMKTQGIYVTTDIYISRWLKPAETGVFDEPSRSVKQLAAISDPVMDNIKSFAKLWLEHVNPYTGIAWKDEPALFGISFINENDLYSTWQSNPVVRELYEKRFAQWKEERKITHGSPEEAKALTAFLTELQIHSYRTMRDYVRDELGCKALYSDCNMGSRVSQAVARAEFDYVDNHGYWDHPRFPVRSWSLPYGFHNLSVLKRYCVLPAEQMPSRVFGKPFTFTEFNYVFPNRYRSEGNPVMGAYAALQGWDAVYRFAFAHNRENATTIRPGNGFDVATDPLTLLGERIISLLFLRADVAEAEREAPFVMTREVARVAGGSSGTGAGFSQDYARLGLVHKTGSVVLSGSESAPQKPAVIVGLEELTPTQLGDKEYLRDGEGLLSALSERGILNPDLYDRTAGVVRSDTGQIVLDANANSLRVVTPRSECLVAPEGVNMAGEILRVGGNTVYATFFAGALDDKPLRESARVLILHLSDIKNTKTKFLDERQSMLDKNGELPHLVRIARAEVGLALTGEYELWALDISGKRLRQVELTHRDGIMSFVADTAGHEAGVMAYELQRR